MNYERCMKIRRTIKKANAENRIKKMVAEKALKEIQKIFKSKTLTSVEMDEILHRKEFYEEILSEEDIIYFEGKPLYSDDQDVIFLQENWIKMEFIGEFDTEIRKETLKTNVIKKIDKMLKEYKIRFSVKNYLKDSLCMD